MLDSKMSASPDEQLKVLGIVLPAPRAPIANYLPFVVHGDLLYLSGQGPRKANGFRHIGKVGADVSIEQAYSHARFAGINLLAGISEALGGLYRVTRIVKLVGFVNATPEFGGHSEVINGCSDLLVEVFGDRGRHARSAVGQGSLPGGITVEVEAVVAFDQSRA